MREDWTTVAGYTVVHHTGGALLIGKGDVQHWVPRSVVIDGETISDGDTDLVIRTWFCEREGIDG